MFRVTKSVNESVLPTDRRFRVCGLDIASSFDLSHVAPIVDGTRTDLTISRVPQATIDAVRRHATRFATLDEQHAKRIEVAKAGDRYLLTLDGVLSVVVPPDGNELLVHQQGELHDDAARLLLGHALSFVLPAHDREALHGAAVEVDGQAIMLFGASGFGKSTLATTLVTRHQARLLADDLCCLRLDALGDVVVEPSAVASWLGGDLPERLGVMSVANGRPTKRLARLEAVTAPVRAGLACFISKAPGAPTLNLNREPDGFVRRFVSHLFNPAVQTRQRFQTHLAVATRLAQQVRCVEVAWDPTPEAAADVACGLIGALARPAA